MTIKGYANYGVLAHEKQTIFTVANEHGSATVSDKIEITIPDGWSISENQMGDLLINSPEGQTYLASEIVGSWGDNPVLRWHNGEKERRVKMEWRAL